MRPVEDGLLGGCALGLFAIALTANTMLADKTGAAERPMASRILAALSAGVVCWALVGYSLVWTDGGGHDLLAGGFARLGLLGADTNANAPTMTISRQIPELAFVAFQMAIAGLTATVFAAILDARSARRWALAAIIWSLLVYYPVARAFWWWPGADAMVAWPSDRPIHAGLMFRLGAIDIAGSGVVHITLAAAGLAVAWLNGRGSNAELQRLSSPQAGPQAGLAVLAMALIAVGANLTPDGGAALALVNTLCAAAAGALSGLLILGENQRRDACATGLVSGAIAVAACANIAQPLASIGLGVAAAPAGLAGAWLAGRCLGDRACWFGAQWVSGTVGMLAAGLLAASGAGEAKLLCQTAYGLVECGSAQFPLVAQFAKQVVGVIFASAVAATGAGLAWWLVRLSPRRARPASVAERA